MNVCILPIVCFTCLSQMMSILKDMIGQCRVHVDPREKSRDQPIGKTMMKGLKMSRNDLMPR